MTHPACIALLLFLTGCSTESEPVLPKAPAGERIVLSPIGLALSVPPDYTVRPRSDDPAGAWIVDLAPGQRQPRRIVVVPDPPGEAEVPKTDDPACPWQGPETFQAATASSIRYHVSVGCGGSGGVEARLAGLWEIGDRRFGLSCVTQAEPLVSGETPDPAWCLELLPTARAVPITDAPVRLGPTGTERRPVIEGEL